MTETAESSDYVVADPGAIVLVNAANCWVGKVYVNLRFVSNLQTITHTITRSNDTSTSNEAVF